MPELRPALSEELRQVVSEVCGIPPTFDPKAHFYKDLDIGSFKSVDLVIALEDRYGVAIPDDQFISATSLDRLTSLMERLVG